MITHAKGPANLFIDRNWYQLIRATYGDIHKNETPIFAIPIFIYMNILYVVSLLVFFKYEQVDVAQHWL